MKTSSLTKKISCLLIALNLVSGHITLAATSNTSLAKSKLEETGFLNRTPAASTDDDDSDEAEETEKSNIRIPELSNVPKADVTVAANNTNSTSNFVCPLTENRPHMELLNSARRLADALRPTEECKNDADASKISEDAKKLLDAGANLQSIWKNPETLTADRAKMTTFQDDISTMVNGINTITTQLQQNSLLNRKCTKELMSAGGLLTAVSDLVANFAPYALIGASLNPSLKVALPFIVGFTGVGSVAKVIRGMADQDALKMKKPENREALLKNICEFSRISQRVRFLKLAQSGQIDQVNADIQRISENSTRQLSLNFSPRVSALSSLRTQFDGNLKKIEAVLKNDQAEHKKVLEHVGTNQSLLSCKMSVEIAKGNADASKFPARAIENFKNVLGNQIKNSAAQSALLTSHKSLEKQLISLSEKDAGNIEKCLPISKSYLQTLDQVLKETRSTIDRLRTAMDEKLNKDKEFARYRKIETATKREVLTLKKVGEILAQLNADNSIIDKSEIDSQIYDLKRSLFSIPEGIHAYLPTGYGKVSPIMAWFEFVEEQQNRTFTDFKRELIQIIRDSYAISKSGQDDFLERDAQGNPLKSRYGEAIKLSEEEVNTRLTNDYNTSQKLENLTIELFEKNPENKKAICQRLENIYLSWASTLDHIAAQNFVCKSIESFLDKNSTDRGLLKKCINQRTVDNRLIRASDVSQSLINLEADGYTAKAKMISAKLKELQCEMPTVSIMQ